MVDWRSPETQGLCAFVFTQMTVFVCGGFGWYLLQTWPMIEGNLIRRRLKLSYAHIPYLTARYSHLLALIMLSVVFNLPVPIAATCNGLYITRVNSVIGNFANTATSANLGVRAFMLWKGNSLVRGFVCLCFATHVTFGIVVGATGVTAVWTEGHTTCMLVSIDVEVKLFSFYIFTIWWDIVILILTISGIRRQRLPSNTALSSALTMQGIGYVIVTCITGIPMAVMASLNLNDILNIFFTIPGCSVSIIASTAFVASLLRLKEGDEIGTNATLPTSFSLLTTNINISHASSADVRTDEDNLKAITVEHRDAFSP